jgi:HAD superfamily hydrolase (TIGR01509 family)
VEGAGVKRVELIIFDCDGVLVDSEWIANRESARLKTELGLPTTTEENIRKFTGLGPRSAEVQEVRRRLPPHYPAMAKERRDRAFRAELKEISGMSKVLGELKIPFCVASSGDLDKIHLTLGLTGLLPLFEDRIFSGQMVEQTKPFPDLFLLAARKMGVAASNCLVIEDSVPGIHAAVAAKMLAVGFLGGSHVYPELGERLMAAGAARVFADMAELPTLIAAP